MTARLHSPDILLLNRRPFRLAGYVIDGTIDPPICPRCVFDPDSRSIANKSRCPIKKVKKKSTSTNREQSMVL